MRPQDGNVDGENMGKMMINHGVEWFFFANLQKPTKLLATLAMGNK
jgi:hypothetical protein